MITLKNTSYTYTDGPLILRDVSMTIPLGSFTVFVGASGSGKTTILKLIAHLIAPTNGTCQTDGVIAMVFQNGALLPWQTTLENVTLPLIAKGMDTTVARNEARAALARVGLADFIEKYPRELSGGQRQRVGIARAIAVKPDILLLDEPFSALDIGTVAELHHDLIKLWQELNLTVVMVSHSIDEAVALGQQVLVVKDGTVSKTVSIPFSYPRPEAPTTERIQLTREISSVIT